jgi:N-acetyl sugar amidotransferase
MIDFIQCTKCIYNSNTSGIGFDNKGVCSYCNEIEDLKTIYQTGKKKGEELFDQILKKIRNSGKNKKYDCIIGVSGGVDSCYLIHLAVTQWKLRPLAVHYDNTWNSAISTINLSKILKKLDIDLFTHVVNNKEINDIYKSFFIAGVPEIEASTDLGYACLLRKIASKYNIKFILEGHSFIDEGLSPIGINYFDGKYIKEIHKKFGSVKMKSYPFLTFSFFLKSVIFDRVKFLRPYWYIDYSKEYGKEILKNIYDWQDYGGNHLENRMSAFYHQVYLPQKFNIDLRLGYLSTQVRNKKISITEALAQLKKNSKIELNLIDYFRKRLSLSENDYNMIMSQRPKYWQSYPTYKKYFEYLSPLFYLFARLNLVTMSFYLKYCKKKNAYNN